MSKDIYPQLLQIFKFNLPKFGIGIFLQSKLLVDMQIMTKFIFLNYIRKETLSSKALADYLKLRLKVMILLKFK